MDLRVDVASYDAPIEDAGISAVDTLAGSDHLENIGKLEFQALFFSFSS